MRKLFQRRVLSRPGLTFLVLCISFAVFGAGTLNLGFLFMANAHYIAANGWMALADGALLQLAELAGTGALSMAAYIVFKTCEHQLSHWLAQAD